MVSTQCARDCPDACLLEAEVEGGRLKAVRGSRDSPATRGFVCPRGAGDPRRVYSAERVARPHRRVGVKPGWDFEWVGWDEALGEAAGRLRDTISGGGAGRVLLLDYSGNTGLVSSLYSQRLWSALGATKTDHSVCALSGHAGLALHHGLTYGLEPEDLPGRGCVVFWGINARVSSIHVWGEALEARRRGAVVVAVDPRRSETAEAADLWIRPRPGGDVALAYGVARALIRRGAVDERFLAEHSSGYDAYRGEALGWTPGRVEAASGVPEGDVEALAEALAVHRPPAVVIGIGMQKSVQGAEAVRAASLLPSLLGEHRGFYYTNSRGRFIDTAGLEGESRGRVVSMVKVGRLLEEGEFGFVYVVNANPAMTLPDLSAVRRGLGRGDVFVVVHDTHATETCRYADIVLPASTFYEKTDVVVSDSHPYTRLSRAAIEPVGESLSEAEVMLRLSRLLGLRDPGLAEDPMDALARSLEGSFTDGDFRDLAAGRTLRLRTRPRAEYQTPSGRIEFASSTDPPGVSPLPEQLGAAGEGLLLLSSAQHKWTHTQFRDVYGFQPCVVKVSPDDAAEQGVSTGDAVTLRNELAEFEATAEVTDQVPRGVLWMPREIEDAAGRPQNALAPPVTQLLGGGNTYNSVRVVLRKARRP